MEWLITNIIGTFLLIWFITSLLDMKTKRICICRILMIIIDLCTIISATHLYIYGLQLTMTLFVINCLLGYIFSYNQTSEIIFIIILEMVYSLTIQILTMFLNNIYPLHFFNLTIYILYFICGIILLKCIKKVQMSFHQIHYYILISTLLCLYLIGQQFIRNNQIITANFHEFNAIFILLLFFIFLLIIHFLSLIHDKAEYEKLKQTQKNEQIINHLYEQLKIIKHDLKHDYQLINHYLVQKDYNKIKELTNYQDKSIASIPVFIKSNNNLINAIVNNKIIEADIKNIKVECFINVPEKLTIQDYILNDLLSNLLDNAIENCPQNRTITINIIYQQQILHINIENSIDQSFDKELKTKKNKKYHGYGLRSIRKIVYQYHGDMDITFHNKTFNIQVSLFLN